MTAAEYRNFIVQRERMIKRTIAKAVRDAIEDLVAKDVEAGDDLGVKYIDRVVNSSGNPKIACGFREGIGITVTVETAYLPKMEEV